MNELSKEKREELLYKELKSKLLIHPLVGYLNRYVKKEECYFYRSELEQDLKKGTIVYKYKCRAYDSVHNPQVDKISFLNGLDVNFIAEVPSKAIDWNYNKKEYMAIVKKYNLLDTNISTFEHMFLMYDIQLPSQILELD